MEYYVHRIGRTGRAGNTGVAFTLIAGSGEFFSLCDIQDTTGIQLQPYYLNGLEETPEDKFYARNTNRNENGPRRSSQPRQKGANGGRSASNGGNAVISFDVGTNHDVTERQIVNSILKYARIKKDEIGEMTIKENESRVELAPDVARHVMRSMQNGTINEFLVVCKAVSGAKEVNAKGEARGNGRRGGGKGGKNGGKPSGGKSRGRVVRRYI
jgi:ATP-dependent RNA helicase DeaD